MPTLIIIPVCQFNYIDGTVDMLYVVQALTLERSLSQYRLTAFFSVLVESNYEVHAC